MFTQKERDNINKNSVQTKQDRLMSEERQGNVTLRSRSDDDIHQLKSVFSQQGTRNIGTKYGTIDDVKSGESKENTKSKN